MNNIIEKLKEDFPSNWFDDTMLGAIPKDIVQLDYAIDDDEVEESVEKIVKELFEKKPQTKIVDISFTPNISMFTDSDFGGKLSIKVVF